MASSNTKIQDFSGSSFLLRFLFALIVVFITYNPEELSYYHWAISPLIDSMESFSVLKAFAGVSLIIAWTILVHATIRSLGLLGIVLAITFFGLMLWLIIDVLGLSTDNLTIITYIIEFVIAAVLSAGVSWSHLRRRLTGQVDMDDVDTP